MGKSLSCRRASRYSRQPLRYPPSQSSTLRSSAMLVRFSSLLHSHPPTPRGTILRLGGGGTGGAGVGFGMSCSTAATKGERIIRVTLRAAEATQTPQSTTGFHPTRLPGERRSTYGCGRLLGTAFAGYENFGPRLDACMGAATSVAVLRLLRALACAPDPKRSVRTSIPLLRPVRLDDVPRCRSGVLHDACSRSRRNQRMDRSEDAQNGRVSNVSSVQFCSRLAVRNSEASIRPGRCSPMIRTRL